MDENEEFVIFKQEMKGVKELVDKGISGIPRFYIDPKVKNEQFNSKSDDIYLPVIDLSEIYGPNRSQIVHEVNKACEEWGFFQVVNHGVSESAMENMLEAVKSFFDMPFEERKEYYSNNLFDKVRFGTSHNPNHEYVLQWKDYLRHPCNPLDVHFPTWPSKPASYRDSAKVYAEATKEVAGKLLELMSEGLGLNRDYLRKYYGEPHGQQLAANYYPPCPNPELTIGISPHSDVGGVTILLQNEVDGLEVLHNDRWIPIQPLKNALIINLGDYSQVISNGRYISVEHRAKVNSENLRISVAIFYQPSIEGIAGPIPQLLDEDHPAVYKSMKFGDYLNGFFSGNLRGKAYIEALKIQN